MPVVTGTIELLQLMLLRGRNYFPSSEDQAKTCINVLFAWASFQKLYLSLLKNNFFFVVLFLAQGCIQRDKHPVREGFSPTVEMMTIYSETLYQVSPAYCLFHRCFDMLLVKCLKLQLFLLPVEGHVAALLCFFCPAAACKSQHGASSPW